MPASEKAGRQLETLAALAAEFSVFRLQISAAAALDANVRGGSRRWARAESDIPQPAPERRRGRADRGRGFRGDVARHGSNEPKFECECPDSEEDNADGSEDEGEDEGREEGVETTGDPAAGASAEPPGAKRALHEARHGQHRNDRGDEKQHEPHSREDCPEPAKSHSRKP